MVVALLLVSGCNDNTSPEEGGWRYTLGTDPGSGRPISSATLSDARSTGMDLIIRCNDAAFEVLVRTPFVIDAGGVRVRLDGGMTRNQTWRTSPDLRAVFYPGDARAFARDLAAADELSFEARDNLGTPVLSTFSLPGLDALLPKIEAACPL